MYELYYKILIPAAYLHQFLASGLNLQFHSWFLLYFFLK